MRRGTQDAGWMHDEQGKLQGVCLGFDFCAEHEHSVPQIRDALGVSALRFPHGVDDRCATRVPENLSFIEYTWKPRDKRRTGVPAAALTLTRWMRDEQKRALVDPAMAQQVLSAFEAGFFYEPGDKGYEPDRHDLACSWCEHSFAIAVRGESNIARLRELHAAFLERDIALGVPLVEGFRRGGLRFLLASRIDDATRKAVLGSDRAYERLERAADATGIAPLLQAAGKGYYALKPDWYDRYAEDEVIFFLNPASQREYNFGWFTQDELRAWARNDGPVLQDLRLEAFRKANPDWDIALQQRLDVAGVGLRFSARLAWADKAKSVMGVIVHPTRESEKLLPTGVYPLSELMSRFAASQAA